VYVGELDFAVTDEVLIDHFLKHYGEVVSVNIICDKLTKLSKGYGFVQLESEEEC
jgi:RNA recognition motif-containing protein